MKDQKIVYKCQLNRQGTQATQLIFIKHLKPKIATQWHKFLQQFANRYATGTAVCSANKVLNLWLKLHTDDPLQYPLPPITPQQAPQLIKNLRRETYGLMVSRNLALTTATLYWKSFLHIIESLSIAGLIPTLNLDSVAYRPYKSPATCVARNQVQDGTLIDLTLAPANLNIKTDSYNTDCLVPLSIHLSDEAYLQNYEKTLDKSIKIFYRCAEQELRNLKRRFNLGIAYIKAVNYKEIKRALNSQHTKSGKINRNHGSYIDPNNGLHFFDCRKKHPKLIRHLVAMVHYEMNGKRADLGHWRYISKYGKNKLLPYLGILTARTAAPFIVLLLLENPRINVQSLLNAKLEDKYGNVLLISKAGENEGRLRITVEKPRANSQKHNLLSDRSIEVLQWLIKFTTPIRKYLHSVGRNEDARWLWVGLSNAKHYEYGRLSLVQLALGFQPKPARLIKYEKRPHTPSFIKSHKSLNPWLGNVSLKTLRVSKGVDIWFKSNGDPVLTAQAFGHRNLQTTLNNYIPRPIQTLMYERQIRRWQNLLICSASINKSYLLEVTDFTTTEQLHKFLSLLIANSTNDTLVKRICNIIAPCYNKTNTTAAKNTKQVLLINDPDRLAILLLYREKLLNTIAIQLDKPDQFTNSTPRMWLELANALSGKLLDDQWELRELVARAQFRTNDLREQFKFTTIEKL